MNKKILLIEDDASIQFLYNRQLKIGGFEPDIAGNGKESIDALTKNDYGLIFLDIMLPDINGIELLKQIKAIDHAKDIPILMLSNLRQEDIITEGLRLGAKEFILKAAINPYELVEIARKYIPLENTQA